jgi:hypothetical protein
MGSRRVALGAVLACAVTALIVGTVDAGGEINDGARVAEDRSDDVTRWPQVTHTPIPDLPDDVSVVDRQGVIRGYIPKDELVGPNSQRRSAVSLPDFPTVHGIPVRMHGDLTGYMVFGYGFADIGLVEDHARFRALMECFSAAQVTRDATDDCQRVLKAEGLGDFLEELRTTPPQTIDVSSPL